MKSSKTACYSSLCVCVCVRARARTYDIEEIVMILDTEKFH
jgi:hypothetical protein